MSTTLPPEKDSTSNSEAAAAPCWGDHLGGDWSRWKKILSRKRTINGLVKALGTETEPVTWALPQSLAIDTKPLLHQVAKWTRDFIKKFDDAQTRKKSNAKGRSSKSKSKGKSKDPGAPASWGPLDPLIQARLREWLDEIGQRPTDPSSALEAICWARALPWLIHQLDEAEWGELFETLRHMAHDAGRMPFGQMPLSRQLLAGELPVTLACIFHDAETDSMGTLGREGLGCVASGMRELLDGEGMVHAGSLPHQRSLLASWTRVLRMARRNNKLHCDEEVMGQFEWLIRQTIRFTRRDGQQMLNGARSGRWNDELLKAAVALDEDPVDLRAATLLPWKAAPKIKSKCKLSQLPNPGCYSEWAECGVLAAGWSPFDARIAFAFDDQELRCEWNAAGRTWFDGVWTFDLSVDGQPLEQVGTIDVTCWHEDEDVDYVEFQVAFEDGWCIQRQMMLDRRHQFAFAADAVLGPRSAEIQCQMAIPLAGAVKPSLAKETRELRLKSRKTTIDVLPLSLPEWRSSHAWGQLVGERERMTFSQRAIGSSLYMPLFIHLNPNRDKQLTWRQLTVAENLKIQTPDVAAGYRVQFGEFQWIFYRALQGIKPRTVLGQHLNCEFLAARFLPDGMVDELVAIEGVESD